MCYNIYYEIIIVATFFISGVQEIDADVDTKIVKVTCAESVASETLLAALNKWSSSSGKSVEYIGM